MTRFGLRIPSFPIDGSGGVSFIGQVLNFLGRLDDSFDSAWVCDHLYPWADFVPRETPNFECLTAISYLSALFPRLTFGSIVLCNSFRSPVVMAKMGATLQMLSGGRFILGIGAGWKENEYRAYGFEFPPAKVRIAQLEEAVRIIREMWTGGVSSFKGRYYRVEAAYCHPKPEPPPPIVIGGGGERYLLRAVARHADWWNIPNVSPETYRHKLGVLEEHCRAVDRDPSEIAKTLGHMVAIAEKRDEAWELARRSPFIAEGEEHRCIIGDPEEVIDQIADYVKLGVEHFVLRFLDFPRVGGARLFAERVIPYFRG
jgi:alkanesulfonate monooxygenase SsuD/methylene tetrahydromethanopterin reductase-like flavin-dependent oxidoreductase (luciferase family)